MSSWQLLTFTTKGTAQNYDVSGISYSNPAWLDVTLAPPGSTDCTKINYGNSTPSTSIAVCFRYKTTPGLDRGYYLGAISIKPGKGATWSPLQVKVDLTVSPPSNLQLWTADGAILIPSKNITIGMQNGAITLSTFNVVGIKSFDGGSKEVPAQPFQVRAYILGGNDAPWVTVTPSASTTNGKIPPATVTLSINAAAANCQPDLTAIVQFDLTGTILRGTDSLFLVQDPSFTPPCVVPLAIGTAAQLFMGIPNQFFSQTLTAAGGTAPYRWTLASGQLPPGLSLSFSGVISGTPSTSGSFSFAIQVSDSAGKATMQTFSLIVASALTITTGLQLPPGGVGSTYSQQLSATGGSPPYTWTLANGNLPAGFSLSPAGVVSGITSNTGLFSFVARVTDSAGAVGVSQSFNVSIQTSAAVTQTAALAHFAAGDTYVTGFFAINKSAQAAQFTVNFYGNDGAPVTLPIAGQAASTKLGATLGPNSSAYYEVGNSQSPLTGGWGQLAADPSIVVQSLFRNRALNGTYFEAAVPSTAGSNEFQIPFDATTFVPTGERLYTGFAIANMDPARVANIVCTARDSGGNVLPNALKPITLNPLGHYADYLFDNLTGRSGTIDCTSNTLIGAVALRFLGNNAFLSLPVILK